MWMISKGEVCHDDINLKLHNTFNSIIEIHFNCARGILSRGREQETVEVKKNIC